MVNDQAMLLFMEPRRDPPLLYYVVCPITSPLSYLPPLPHIAIYRPLVPRYAVHDQDDSTNRKEDADEG